MAVIQKVSTLGMDLSLPGHLHNNDAVSVPGDILLPAPTLLPGASEVTKVIRHDGFINLPMTVNLFSFMA